MLCTRKIKRECKYARICGMEDCEVADDSECADFIMEVTNRLEALDAVEVEYLRQERQAIQEEANMTNAEKAEKGLEACTTAAIGCKGCPYWNSGGSCVSDCMRDAAELIRQLKNGGETPAAREV